MQKLMAVLAITLAACGGSSDKAGGTGASGFATACSALLAVEANLLKSCAKVNPALFLPNNTLDSSRICPFIESEINAGRVRYDATQWATCLAAYQATTCADLPPGTISGEPAVTPAACTAALTGAVALGGTCQWSPDCSNGSCSSDASLTCPGTCQPFQTAGGNCGAQRCGPGLVCAYNSATATTICKVLGAAGAACPCQPELWCNPANAGGHCELPIAPGGACVAYSPGCPGGYVCKGATSTTNGTCQPWVGLGGACSATDRCSLGYQCVSGTCASWADLGQDCTNSACLAGYCDSSTALCTPYLADGATCDVLQSKPCLSQYCNPATLKCERTACRP
jgi:hypothetical protein